MDAAEASRIISKAEGGDTSGSTPNGASPTSAMDAAMHGSGAPATSTDSGNPVTVNLEAGMMTGEDSSDDKPPPAGWDDHKEDKESSAKASDLPDHMPSSPAENTAADAATSDTSSSSQSPTDTES
jgi:hypothetical protein